MSHATPSESEITDTLSHLKLSTASKAPLKPKKKPAAEPVADSWDDDVSSGADTETEDTTTASTTATSDSSPVVTIPSYESPTPPPPTPASPITAPFDFPAFVNHADSGPGSGSGGRNSRSESGTSSPTRRPEKTTAVAGRLIAGALGVRAPKRSEEEREFDRLMREKEKRAREERRERERKEIDEAERRKKAVWED